MLKKIVNIWTRLTTPRNTYIPTSGIGFIKITQARGIGGGCGIGGGGGSARYVSATGGLSANSLFEKAVSISARNIDLERQLRDARTRASKNGCPALLAFGLIAIEILGVALYFLPK
jgi:hypothetical protein